jgi:sigma-54 specific flagellar transcriptional regulator A
MQKRFGLFCLPSNINDQCTPIVNQFFVERAPWADNNPYARQYFLQQHMVAVDHKPRMAMWGKGQQQGVGCRYRQQNCLCTWHHSIPFKKKIEKAGGVYVQHSAINDDGGRDLILEDSTPRSVENDAFKGIVGQSTKMQEIFRLVERVADSDSTILINGETGTGKGLIAQAIHKQSYRKDKPFVSINCGAIPENLLESELFGHLKGAFTGATANKVGKFEAANGGTIFLDEIGDMSQDLQVKILKVLEERCFEPVGGCKTVTVNVRIVAATHRDLEEEVQKGNFREDLFYRLFVIPVNLPSLRERRSDIPHFVAHFLNCLNQAKKTQVVSIADDALNVMMQHAWPGNVRELANLMERMVVIKGKGEIDINDLPEKMKSQSPNNSFCAPEITGDGLCLSTAVSEFEKRLIYQSLEKTKWVKNRAAQLLQVKRTTLVEKIKRYELQKCA